MNKGNGFSLNDLFEFLDFAAERGLMKTNTANAQKAACSQILGILDDAEKSDLRKMDIDSAFKRYTNLHPTRLRPDSLKSYHSRVKKALDGFLSYRNDPSNWKPAIQQRKSPHRPNNERQQPMKSPEQSLRTVESIVKTLTVPFPIRDDLTIIISNIPRDLKVIEAKRLAAFLETLSVDFKPGT